jgi:RNA polymerase sigma-70 factor (ECF subfamily)
VTAPQRTWPHLRTNLVTEPDLAAAAQSGDAEAFGRLVMGYALVARRVAQGILGNWEEAEDAVQDASLAAWQAIDRYDPARAFRPWFIRIVANQALDQLRRRKLRDGEELNDAAPSLMPSPEVMTDRALLRGRIAGAMRLLPERQRTAVTLFDGEGYSHAEIAAILQVPEGTVRSYVFHARRALRKTLASLMEAPA